MYLCGVKTHIGRNDSLHAASRRRPSCSYASRLFLRPFRHTLVPLGKAVLFVCTCQRPLLCTAQKALCWSFCWRLQVVRCSFDRTASRYTSDELKPNFPPILTLPAMCVFIKDELFKILTLSTTTVLP